MTTQADRRAMSGEIKTPMIDVILVLVIICMLMQPIRVRRAIDIQLPPYDQWHFPIDPTEEPLLEVLPGRAFYLNRRFVSVEQLGARFREVYGGRPSKVLFVAGPPAARYQDVITALDSARGAGVKVFGILPRS